MAEKKREDDIAMKRLIIVTGLSILIFFITTLLFTSCSNFIDDPVDIIVLGITYNGSDLDWWLKKFSENGIEDTDSWDKRCDGGNGYDHPNAVAVDLENNIYAVGTTTGVTDSDWWIKKFNSNGEEDTIRWNKCLDSGNGNEYPYSIAVDSEDNVYVAGCWNNSGNADWMIKKFDSKGNEDTINWNKTFDWSGNTDNAYSVAIDSKDNVYIAGRVLISTNDCVIKKFDCNGNEDMSWNKIIPGGSEANIPNQIAVDRNDNVYVIGTKKDVSDTYWWIKKFDSSGNEDTANWDKNIDGTLGNDFAYAVAIDYDNNVYCAGTIYNGNNHDWWIKKFDSDGTEDIKNWNKIFDGALGNDTCYSIAIDRKDNVYAVGNSLVEPVSDFNWWIKKFRSDGVEDTGNWDKLIGGGFGADSAYSAAVLH